MKRKTKCTCCDKASNILDMFILFGGLAAAAFGFIAIIIMIAIGCH